MLDKEEPSDKGLLKGYKGQHSVTGLPTDPRRFWNIRVYPALNLATPQKNPQFLANPLYLQDEKRIMALLVVMTLCPLVYSALQWRIRQGLKETGRSYPDQKGYPTQTPTA